MFLPLCLQFVLQQCSKNSRKRARLYKFALLEYLRHNRVGNFLATLPHTIYQDFLKDRPSKEFRSVKASYYGGTEFKNLKECLPDFVYESLKLALPKLNLSLKGFNDNDAVLTAIESRSSCPTKMVRVDYESSIPNIFVGGEGSGHSGGITTSAIDGIKCSNAIINKIKKDT